MPEESITQIGKAKKSQTSLVSVYGPHGTCVAMSRVCVLITATGIQKWIEQAVLSAEPEHKF